MRQLQNKHECFGDILFPAHVFKVLLGMDHWGTASILFCKHSSDYYAQSMTWIKVRLLPLLGLLLFAKGRHMPSGQYVLWMQNFSEAWVSGSYKW